MTADNEQQQKKHRRPFMPWELPALLQPVHEFRQTPNFEAQDRPHYPAVLQFVYENKVAVGLQIQRRFRRSMGSYRTARRQLVEMQQLGYLDLAPTRNVSPVWPKVYFVTGRGLRKLRAAHKAKGKPWPTAVQPDRKSRHSQEGYSSEHVLHEILITEFLLAVWQTIEQRDDLELVFVQRRSLAKQPGFDFTLNGQERRLRPDALFMFRQKESGPVLSLLEMDTGKMNRMAMKGKMQRYHAWSRSNEAQQFLAEVYRRHGSANADPNFRVLFVCNDRANAGGEARVRELFPAILKSPASWRERFWFTTVGELTKRQHDPQPLGAPIWRRGKDARPWLPQYRQLAEQVKGGDRRLRDFLKHEIANLPRHPVFPQSG